VAGDTIAAAGRHVAGERRRTLGALRSLSRVRAIVAGVAPAGADRGMVHRIGRKARCRVGVAVAALNPCHRNVRRRLHPGRSGAVVAARAVGVGCRVGECSACPAGERRGRARVAGHAILAAGRHVARQRRRTLGALRSLSRVRAVVAGVATAGADRGMVHRVGREARCRVGVAVAALNSRYRDVRRRDHAGRRGAVVAARAVGVGCRVGECSARPAGERRGRTRVAGHAILAAGRHVARQRSCTLGALRSLSRVRAIVASITSAGADRGMVHRVGREARRRICVTIAALNSRHRDVRRRLQAGRRRAVMAVRAVGVGRGVNKRSARPARKGRGRAGVAGFAIGAVGRHVAGE